MHLLIPFAAPLSPACRQAAAVLRLPGLQSLLARWVELQRDDADEHTFSPPHERAQARALGWHGEDGCLPWAARAALADGIDTGAAAFGLVTPAHWLLGTDQVSLTDPSQLALDDASSRTFLAAVTDLFTSEGFEVHYGAPLRWYVAHVSLETLAAASLDRVIGRNVDAWFSGDAVSRRLRRLQSEVQMRLYTHPLNDTREAGRLPTVNSFWLSGCGVAQPVTAPEPQNDARLRAPALTDDGAAWARAWEALDAGPLARLANAKGGEPRLTLCGDRSAVTWGPATGGVVERLRRRWSPPTVSAVLESL